jgi:glutathione S-transferase
MKLLGTLTSPYTRKARLVALEKELPCSFVVDPPREPGSQVPRANPLARVPTLVLDDGTVIYDSPVICEYLDSLHDRPALIPRSDPLARMRVRRWEALADGIMDSAVVVRLESLRPPERQDAATTALHGGAITRALAHADAQLSGRPWCEGDALSLADLALVSALLYLDLRQPERDWRGQHPVLATFAARLCARPSVKASQAA